MNKAAVNKGTFQVTQDRLFVNDESGSLNATQQCGGGLLLSVDDLLAFKAAPSATKSLNRQNVAANFNMSQQGEYLSNKVSQVFSHSWSEIDEHFRQFQLDILVWVFF